MGYKQKEGIGSGRITKNIQPDTLRSKIIDFIYQQLPAWRDHSKRPSGDSEKQLNTSLCKYLSVTARTELPAVYFQHEEPQGGHRAVDLSALPTEEMLIEAVLYSPFDPVLVVECKRLPAPSRDREKEYVTGEVKQSGGIQRFKLGVHGAGLNAAIIIGYIQKGDESIHFGNINKWIKLLAAGSLKDGCKWMGDEILEFIEGNKSAGIFKYHSKHGRLKGEVIVLYHLWIKMN